MKLSTTMKAIRGVCTTGGFLAAAFSFTSCFNHKSISQPSIDRKFKEISRVGVGMSAEEVKSLIGSPDEIRTVDSEHLLDGVRVWSSRNTTNGEVHRWAYSLRQPGTFARGGVVSFDSKGQVIASRSPIGPGSVSPEPTRPPRSEIPPSDGLSCRIDDITLEEARGEGTPRAWSAKVTVANDSNVAFSADCFVDSIHRQCAVEVYDKDKTMIFHDDHSNIDNGFGSRRSKFIVPAGARRTEQLNFTADLYFGPLPPGRYFLRVLLRRSEGVFINSALVDFTVPSFPKTKKWFKSLSPKIKMRQNENVSVAPSANWVVEEFSHSLSLQRTRHHATIALHAFCGPGR